MLKYVVLILLLAVSYTMFYAWYVVDINKDNLMTIDASRCHRLFKDSRYDILYCPAVSDSIYAMSFKNDSKCYIVIFNNSDVESSLKVELCNCELDMYHSILRVPTDVYCNLIGYKFVDPKQMGVTV